jgi:holdfast attachment protein HfaA
MPVKRRIAPLPTVVAVMMVALPTLAAAQSTGSSGAAQFQQGYGSARSTTSTATTGSTRDANGNRLIVNGIIQSGASTYSSQSGGVASAYAGAGSGSSGTTIGGSTAIGNQLNVVVQGSHNTVIVNSKQTNNGDVSAGTALNGSLNLP